MFSFWPWELCIFCGHTFEVKSDGFDRRVIFLIDMYIYGLQTGLLGMFGSYLT